MSYSYKTKREKQTQFHWSESGQSGSNSGLTALLSWYHLTRKRLCKCSKLKALYNIERNIIKVKEINTD